MSIRDRARLGLICASFWTSALLAENADIQTQVVADFVGEFNNKESNTAEDSLTMRGVELILNGKLNPDLKARVNFAAHSHDGESHVILHEAFMDHVGLLPETRLRLGQFFLGFGLLNQTHTHDWSFVDAPFYHQKFFGTEGVADTGVEIQRRTVAGLPIQITAGLSNGRTFDDPHAKGEKPNQPTHYLRVANALDSNAVNEHQVGANIVRRIDSEGTVTTYYGGDMNLNWYDDNYTVFLLQSEVWLRYSKAKSTDVERLLGAFLYPEFGFSEQWQCGIRVDYFEDLSLQDALGDPIENYDVAFVPTLSYSPQDGLTMRAAFRHRVDHRKDLATMVEQAWLAQLTYMFGAHVH